MVIFAKTTLTIIGTTPIIDAKGKYSVHSVLFLLLVLLHIVTTVHPLLNNVDLFDISLSWIFLLSLWQVILIIIF